MQHYKQLFFSSVVVVIFLLLMQHTIPTRYIFSSLQGLWILRRNILMKKIIHILVTGFLFHKFFFLVLILLQSYLETLETRGGDTIAELFIFHIIEKNK